MKALVSLASLLMLIGCTKISYVGEEHFPTTHVDIYYSQNDINREYTVMGEAVATGDWTISFEKLQQEIRKKAMKKGADGVIILSWGPETKMVWTENTKETDSTSETTLSQSEETTGSKEIRVALIRYK